MDTTDHFLVVRSLVPVLILVLLVAGCSSRSPAPKSVETVSLEGPTATPTNHWRFNVTIGPTLSAADSGVGLKGQFRYEGTNRVWDERGRTVLVHNFTREFRFLKQESSYQYLFDAQTWRMVGRGTPVQDAWSQTHWIELGHGPFAWGPVGAAFILLMAQSETMPFEVGGATLRPGTDDLGASVTGSCSWRRLDVAPAPSQIRYFVCIGAGGQVWRAGVEGWDNLTYVYSASPGQMRLQRVPFERPIELDPLPLRVWDVTQDPSGALARTPPTGAEPGELKQMAKAVLVLPHAKTWLANHPQAFMSSATFWWRDVQKSFAPQAPPVPADLALIDFREGREAMHFSVFRTRPTEHTPAQYVALTTGNLTSIFASPPFDQMPQELVPLDNLREAYVDQFPHLGSPNASLPSFWWFGQGTGTTDPRRQTMWLLMESCERDDAGRFLIGAKPHYAFVAGVNGEFLASGSVRVTGGCGMQGPNYLNDDDGIDFGQATKADGCEFAPVPSPHNVAAFVECQATQWGPAAVGAS